MAVVNKCCCCCQLRTGVAILGWFGMVLALFRLTSAAVVYANLDDYIVKLDIGGQHLEYAQNKHTLAVGLSYFLPMVITGAVVNLVACILLVWGSSIGNRFMLLPWLILEMFAIISSGIFVLVGGIIFLSIDSDVGPAVGATVLLIGIPFVALYLYIWLCVLSCFQEMRDSPTMDENALLEIPKPFENIVDYRPSEYARLERSP